MKVCFSFQRSFAYISHHLAALLHARHPDWQFCGYGYLRSSFEFLKRQTELSYTALLLDEDIHERYKTETLDKEYLDRLEKEFGIPNLWPYLALDRMVMFNQLIREYPYDTPHYTHEEMLRILQVKTKAIIAFMEQEKPDVIFFPNIGSVSTYFLYQYAKKRGVRTFFVSTAATEDRFVISERYDCFTGVDTIFLENRRAGKKGRRYAEAIKLLKAFRDQPKTYNRAMTPMRQPVSRRQQLAFLTPAGLFASVRWFLHLLYIHLSTNYSKDYNYIHLTGYLIDRVKRKIRNLIGVSDLYDPFMPEKEEIAFFPLHHEPEISLLLLAPFATNQIELVRAAARSLPVTWKLYVKEHPYMVQYRPRSYYRQLKKIPNVKLIDPRFTAIDIIRHAKLIITASGSAIWEGLMLKKPGIAFGHQFYNILSMVKKVTDLEELPALVKSQIEQFSYDEKELLDYLAALLEEAVTIDLFYLWEHEGDEKKKREKLRPLAGLLEKKIVSND